MFLHALELTLGLLGVLVVHELGHLLVARAFGINAVTVMIGFGPKVARYTDSRGTCWQLGLLLIGSSCVFPDKPASPRARSRSIRSLSLTQRATILLAGPLTNMTLAGALFLAIYIQDDSFSVAQLGATDAHLTFLIGGVSMAVALFDLLPVFPLDGGRLTLVAFEAIAGREISRERERLLFMTGLIFLSIAGALVVILLSSVLILKPS